MAKKLISILTVLVCLCMVFVGCGTDKTPSDNNSLSSDNTGTKPTVSDTSSDLQSSEPAILPESKPESSTPVNTSSVTSTVKPQLTNVTVGPYEIYDALNSRGLSTTKSGFGFGVAKNGQPHSMSVNNQKRFDSMQNIEALALDTKSTDKRMYLTFDCGYEYKNLTANILDTLKEKQVKAAFFLTGDYVKKNHTLVKRMIDEGHIVGNHSWGHKSFPTISREKMAKEIWQLEDYLKTNFNYSSQYFRFPSGEHSECALELVSSMGYKSIFWSSAYADWDTSKQPTKESAVNTVTSRYHSGAVILLHAVSQANADGLADMIDIAHQQGYVFKTLDEYYQ
ncbi:MAG: polysaccharide deacetylase family protein [Clostridia bacterium]|nr:polysaccharide deacetylase family protein [Clostridia bacterium]